MAATMPTEPSLDSMALACGRQAAAPFGADIDLPTYVIGLALSALRYRPWSGRCRNLRARAVRHDRLAGSGQVEEKTTAPQAQPEQAAPDPRVRREAARLQVVETSGAVPDADFPDARAPGRQAGTERDAV